MLLLVKFYAFFEHLDEVFHWFKVPEFLQVFCLLLDEVLATGDHLVGQLFEQFDDVHFVGVVLVDVVDHADGVEE